MGAQHLGPENPTMSFFFAAILGFITCVLFFVTRFETRDEGKITNSAVNVGQHLMQAKMQANFSFFSQAQGRFAVEMVGIVRANAESGVMLWQPFPEGRQVYPKQF